MGNRREPRKLLEVPVRIFGTDSQGRVFSENVTTVDISRTGARLAGVRAQINIEEIIGLTYGCKKVHFRVKWTGAKDSALNGQVGLLNLTPERPLWDFSLPAPALDDFRPESMGDRRSCPRLKCAVSVELKAEGEANMWGKASDIGLGGCFVEMPIPLKQGTNFEIALWLAETKLKLKATVASSAPGFGIGIAFLDVTPQDRDLLGRYMQTLTPEA